MAVVFFNQMHTAGKFRNGFAEYYWNRCGDEIVTSLKTPLGHEIDVTDPRISGKILAEIEAVEAFNLRKEVFYA